ncbi:hypothetical protein XH99_09855 [Bradyrhizobium nanningense]|uniref:Uncharacterized protein n=1 Tax=Bradyrhizobium nanningense TaxID=1325118 RepID=A0A4Q0SA22_9BRAD|nr:hypothetical protein XH99_09855 [Bradyrhizobium nanningense]RXH34500.1 hypothetical protein XH84_06795 [Bradyrhizobium nanningense]
MWADATVPVPARGPVGPPSQEEIKKGVQITAAEAKLARPIEISTLRKADHGPGGYFVCLREANQLLDRPRLTYSLFFDGVYKFSRQSVIIEDCERQEYSAAN